MSDDDLEPAGTGRDAPLHLVSEILRTVPRLVDRTRTQAELAASLVSHLPCLGPLLRGTGSADGDDVPPGLHETVGIDVLSLLEEGPDGAEDLDVPAGRQVDRAAPAPERIEAPPAGGPPPSESELPIQDYDSLAASQVVPRLTTMSADDLRRVQSYELAHRHRQTILNRIAQRLAE